MSLTYGFYNAINHDRRYNAIQMSSIFDGIIEDGVFMTIGNRFQVLQNNGMVINIDTGRAWFNHTWTLNDALLPLTVSQSEIILDRIDAVVLEVNAQQSVRANSIKIIKGTPASSPVRPILTNTEFVHQHALAYIYVRARVTEIRQADITNVVGTSETPFVTGPLKTISIDQFVNQWEDEWRRFFENQTSDMLETNSFWKEQWRRFFENQTSDMLETNSFWKEQWRIWFQAQTSEIQEAYLNWEYQWNAFYTTHANEIEETAEYWKQMWQQWFYDYVNKSLQELAYWKKLIQEDWTEYSSFWKEQWRIWFQAQTSEIQLAYLSWEKEWETWYTNQTSEVQLEREQWETLWNTWFYNYVNTNTKEFSEWRETIDMEFKIWWQSIKDLLDNPTAEFAEALANLTDRVEKLEDFDRQLIEERTFYDTTEDSDGNTIVDSNGNEILFQKIIFVTSDMCSCGWGSEVARLEKRIGSIEVTLNNLVARLSV